MFIAILVASSTAASLSGSVTNDDGAGLSGVTVYAVDHRLGYATAVTGNDGEWGIENLPEGPYRVWAVTVPRPLTNFNFCGLIKTVTHPLLMELG